MIVVRDIIERAYIALGTTDQQVVFEQLSDAVEALANKSDWSPLIGYADICVDGISITLPREIETVLAVNLGGQPSFARDRWFEFHLNGPGTETNGPSGYRWDDRGQSPVVRNPDGPSLLFALVAQDEDVNVPLRVFGFDEKGAWIRSKEGNVWRDGFLVPTLPRYTVPNAEAPLISRITRVQKGISVGQIKLLAHDSNDDPILIGEYQPDEVNPSYRRILVPPNTSQWARLLYRKRTHVIRSLDDAIPLHSRLALILMLKALHYYETDRLIDARQFEAAAVGYLEEEQRSSTVPASSGPQITGLNQIFGGESLD